MSLSASPSPPPNPLAHPPPSERLALILETVFDGILIVDAQGSILFANGAAQRLLGQSDLLGHHLGLPLIPEQGFTDIQFPHDGAVGWAELRSSPIAWEDAPATLVSLRDITRRKQTEKMLRDHNELRQVILDAVFAHIAVLDRRGMILMVNRAWRCFAVENSRLLGQPLPRADIGADYLAICRTAKRYSDLPPSVCDDLQAVLEGRLPSLEVEYPCHTPDEQRWFLMTATSLAGDGGVIAHSNITERKHAEEQLRIAAVAFQSRNGMVVTSPCGIILQVNRAFTEITGYTAEEAMGQTPALLKSGRHDTAFYRTLWEAIRHEGRWEGQIWNRRKDGGIYPEWLSVSAICDSAGAITHYLGVFSDISDPREAERKILELAFYDPLTGLPNRRLLLDRIHQALLASARDSQCGALLFLDLDRFKTLNDTRGHDTGDQLLIEVAQRLRGTLRESDTAARLGGDEFVVLLEGLGLETTPSLNAVEAIVEKLHDALGQPYEIQGETYPMSVSLGITLFQGRRDSVETLLKQADLALYQAKNAGRNAFRFYDPAMQAAIDAHAQREAGLRRALAENELLLFYQPQVEGEGHLIGFEALLRWQPPGQAMVSPADFIPVAEESHLIVAIGRWVLNTACQQLAVWARNPATRSLRIAVNISARQFHQADFVDQVCAALAASGANPACLELELTESLLVGNVEQVASVMAQLKHLGITFSLDDFGTGYSSLAYLKRLPLDQLKIDQSFVRDIPADPDDCAIVQAIIALGQSLRLQVIAEGVETAVQHDFLASLGCHVYQGYLFGRPGPVTDLVLSGFDF